MSTPKSEAAIEVGARCASRGSSRRAVLVLQSADLQRVLQKSAIAKPAVVKAAMAGNTMGQTAANLPSQNCNGESRCKSAAAQKPPQVLQLQTSGSVLAKSEAGLRWGTQPGGGGRICSWGEKRAREQSSSWWQGAGTPPAAGSVP